MFGIDRPKTIEERWFRHWLNIDDNAMNKKIFWLTAVALGISTLVHAEPVSPVIGTENTDANVATSETVAA